MAQCPNCGTYNPSGKFCAQCGTTLAPSHPGPQPPRTNTARNIWIAAGVAAGLVVVVGGAALFLGGSDSAGPSRVSGGAPAGQSSNSGTPASPSPSSGSRPKLPSDPNNPLVGGFIRIRVPGAAYTQSDGSATYLYVSSGTMTASSLLINPDGTYAWNSQWDGKLIRGTWVKDNGEIVLQKAQEGKDWRVGKSNQGGDVLIYTSSTWYIADRARD